MKLHKRKNVDRIVCKKYEIEKGEIEKQNVELEQADIEEGVQKDMKELDHDMTWKQEEEFRRLYEK